MRSTRIAVEVALLVRNFFYSCVWKFDQKKEYLLCDIIIIYLSLNVPGYLCPFAYQNITDSWRKIGSSGGTHCDRYDFGRGFDGNKWFRFVEPAGTKLSNTDNGFRACQSDYSGWMNGADPTIIGQALTRTACWHACRWRVNIKVALCRGHKGEPFYVYQLKHSPTCNLAYCAE